MKTLLGKDTAPDLLRRNAQKGVIEEQTLHDHIPQILGKGHRRFLDERRQVQGVGDRPRILDAVGLFIDSVREPPCYGTDLIWADLYLRGKALQHPPSEP